MPRPDAEPIPMHFGRGQRNEVQAVRVAACVALMALSLAMAGCKMFGKKSSNGSPNTGQSPSPALADRGSANSDRAAPPAGVNGILAGQIIDSYNRKPPPTVIQVVATQDGKETGAAPITVKLDPVNTDAQGYFTIQNLQPGRQYQLIARAEDGGKKLAGVTWAKPPNPRVTIRLSEDFAGKDIPEGPPPNKPRSQNGQSKPEEKPKDPAAYIEPPIPAHGRESSNVPWTGSTGNGASSLPGGAEIGFPIPGNRDSQAPREPEPRFDPERTTLNHDEARNASPKVDIRGPKDPRESGSVPGVERARPAIPSCSLSGRHLHDFALNDIEGKPWQFSKDRKGELVLIDFWGTWCVPCQYAIPHLKDLQWRYGPWGLEVVGIAYEHGMLAQQQQSVRRVANRLQTNYRLLLGSGYESDCPVRRQFQVRSYPTLFLVDKKGTILWEAREGLNERELQELEFEIKKRLSVR